MGKLSFEARKLVLYNNITSCFFCIVSECPLLEVPLYKSIHTLIGSILIIRKEKGSRGGKEKMEGGKMSVRERKERKGRM